MEFLAMSPRSFTKRLVASVALAGALLVPGVAMAQENPAATYNGLTLPAASPAMAFVAPSSDDPNYAARLQVFLQAEIGEPFRSAYEAAGGTDALGLPTSAATADPNNPNFVYQRFQNGILFYNVTADTVETLPIGPAVIS
jgi:hypothetical protein